MPQAAKRATSLTDDESESHPIKQEMTDWRADARARVNMILAQEASVPDGKRRSSAPVLETGIVADRITIVNAGDPGSTRTLVCLRRRGSASGLQEDDVWHELVPAFARQEPIRHNPQAPSGRIQNEEASAKWKALGTAQHFLMVDAPVLCQDTFKEMARHLTSVWSLCQDTFNGMIWHLAAIWNLLRTPIITVGTYVFIILLLLQVLALVYTFGSRTFLDSFCSKKVRIIRNWICSEWDAVIYNPLFNDTSPWDPSEAFTGTIWSDVPITFLNDFSVLSYRMTEVKYRLPFAELEEPDRQFLNDTIRLYLAQSQHIIDNTSSAMSHLIGTVEFLSSNTIFMAEIFNSTIANIDPTPAASTSFLSSILIYLSSLSLGSTPTPLIYLPWGSPALLEGEENQLIKPLSQLQAIVTKNIIPRVTASLDRLNRLREQFQEAATLADQAATRSNEIQADSKRDKVALRAIKRCDWPEFLVGESTQNFKINNRLIELKSMNPVFSNANTFLIRSANQLLCARDALKTLREKLTEEKEQLIGSNGRRVDQWLPTQIRILEDRGNVIKDEVANFKQKKQQFDSSDIRP